MADRKLGRGLDGLLKGVSADAIPDLEPPAGPVSTLAIALLDPNPFQPRQGFPPDELENLKGSIREHGLLQPIVVRPAGARYQIIAGERRFRAAQALAFTEVPVVVRDVPDDQMLELALVENLQREDLDPIEKAMSFKAYLARSGKTQEAAAVRLGLDRSTIANIIRLLELPDVVQGMVREGLVSMGHARALLAVEDAKRQVALAERVVREGLSVRQVERLVSASGARPQRRRPALKSPLVRDIERRLREALGTKVTIEEGTKPGTGRILVEFYAAADLDRILERLA